MAHADPQPNLERCDDIDPDAGQCQLLHGHDGQHAASVGDAYLTWQLGDLHGWSLETPPHWLVDLPWAPGFSPSATQGVA